ncbi:LacI family DNA-binding transcriptional regulator [Pseudarthrobacter oxydans]|uniref:substrate-binding domain-containing protein n=1 Tax=Pseudarthrobacter oxydans TaxID=1671 RepID=UPI003ECCF2F4
MVVDDYGHGGRSGLDAVEHLAPQVDAVIGYLGGYANQAQSVLGRRPLIVLDETPGGAAGSINFDYQHAARVAVDQLTDSKRQHIAYLEARSASESGEPAPCTVRGKAVAGRLDELGASWSLIVAEETAEAARKAAAAFLQDHPETDGFLAFNDLMAAGVLKALSGSGRRVPGDCAVIGMDGIPLGELLSPQLSTMALDLREVGRTAVELLGWVARGSQPRITIIPEDLETSAGRPETT